MSEQERKSQFPSDVVSSPVRQGRISWIVGVAAGIFVGRLIMYGSVSVWLNILYLTFAGAWNVTFAEFQNIIEMPNTFSGETPSASAAAIGVVCVATVAFDFFRAFFGYKIGVKVAGLVNETPGIRVIFWGVSLLYLARILLVGLPDWNYSEIRSDVPDFIWFIASIPICLSGLYISYKGIFVLSRRDGINVRLAERSKIRWVKAASWVAGSLAMIALVGSLTALKNQNIEHAKFEQARESELRSNLLRGLLGVFLGSDGSSSGHCRQRIDPNSGYWREVCE